jgi:urease accessory protein
MVEDPPVAWRPTPEAVYLVGTAGGLTGDDDIGLDVCVASGGALVVRSTAATVVYAGTATRHRICLRAGAGSSVDWRTEPVVVTAGASHVQEASLYLAPTARLDWTDLVVLGRHGEAPGRADLRLDCVITGEAVVAGGVVAAGGVVGAGGAVAAAAVGAGAVEPARDRVLLRHHLSVGPGAAGWAGPAVVGANRSVGVRLRVGPDLSPPPTARGDGWAWMRLDGPGWLLSAVAPDLPTLLERMAAAAG